MVRTAPEAHQLPGGGLLALSHRHRRLPLALRLYLPESWTRDPDRLTTVGVPRTSGTSSKWRIALDLLDTVLAEDLPAGLIVADGAYGECGAFRQGLEDRGCGTLSA